MYDIYAPLKVSNSTYYYNLQEAPEGFLSQDLSANGSHPEAGSSSHMLNRGFRGLNFSGDLPDWNLAPHSLPNHLTSRQEQSRALQEDPLVKEQQTTREASSEDEETLRQRFVSIA